MYSTDPHEIAKPPVVLSGRGAEAALARWLEENDIRQLADAEGQKWTLHLKPSQVGDAESTHGLLWQVSVLLTLESTGPEFVAAGVLEEDRDERLLLLLGSRAITLEQRPVVLKSRREEDLRSLIAQEISKRKQELAEKPWAAVKRDLIGRSISRQQVFGGSAGLTDRKSH